MHHGPLLLLPKAEVMDTTEYCPHCCDVKNCLACRDTFVNNAVVYLYEKRFLMGMTEEQHQTFKEDCWRNAQALWKARVGP